MNENYLATTLPGIGAIAEVYLKEKFGNAIALQSIHHLRNNDILMFKFYDDPEALLKPSLLEDVFLNLGKIKLKGERNDLIIMKKWSRGINLKPHLSQKHQSSIRVVVQAGDVNWREYRRLDIKGAIESGLKQNAWINLKVVPENAHNELWAQQVDSNLILSLRLSDRTMRHREYKISNYPGSLRPSIAYAMGYLSGPAPDDVVLDPMCGAGTILIERASSRYKLLVGFDNNPQAIDATLENFGKKHKPWEINLGDVTNLPLEDSSVDVVITNPPWGVQMEADLEFYKKMLSEVGRVLKPNGRLVLLMRQGALPDFEFQNIGITITSKHKNIFILGQRAEIIVGKKY